MAFQPEGIIIHCSATRPDWMEGAGVEAKRDEIKRWHVNQNKWRDIGYAELGDYDGSHAMGRDLNGNDDPFDDIGAHTKGWNSKAIGLCLIGGHGASKTDSFEDHFTPEQDAWLRDRIAELKNRFPSIKWVKGHNDFAAKGCPGFQVGPWLKRKPAKQPTVTGFLKGSKDVKVAAAVASVGAANEAIGEVKTLFDQVEALLGFNPWFLIIGAALAWWILGSRLPKFLRGVV
jgi:hypothetical protein